jgi:hypothetical protein
MGRGHRKGWKKAPQTKISPVAEHPRISFPEDGSNPTASGPSKAGMLSQITSWPVIAIAVPILITFGVGGMSMNPPDFIIAKSVFALAAGILSLKVAYWLVRSGSKPVERLALGLVVFGAIGVLAVESWGWIDRRTLLMAHNAKEKEGITTNPAVPKIVANDLWLTLAIDSVNQGFVQFHFVIQNQGSALLNVKGLTYSTLTMRALEGPVEIDRDIPPNNHLVNNSDAFVKDLVGGLTALITYSAGKSDQRFTGRFGFDIRPLDLQRNTTVEPTSRTVMSGDSTISLESVGQGLKTRPEGSVTFWFNEKRTDGKPNRIFLSADSMNWLSIDSNTREIIFVMDISGKARKEIATLPNGIRHMFAATWKKDGQLKLYIDGKKLATRD